MTPAGGDPDPGREAVTTPPRAALLRFALLAALILGGAMLLRWTPLGQLLDQHRLARALEDLRQTPWAPPILLGLWLVLAPLGIPVSPLVFAGGAVFGIGWGWVYNFLGCLLGATSSYLVARRLGQEMTAYLLDRFGLTGVEALLERHGFWALLRVRLVPLPFVVVNYAAALVGMPLRSFLAASALGFAPSVLVYTYFSHALAGVAAGERTGVIADLALALAAMLGLTLLPTVLARLKARRARTRAG